MLTVVLNSEPVTRSRSISHRYCVHYMPYICALDKNRWETLVSYLLFKSSSKPFSRAWAIAFRST